MGAGASRAGAVSRFAGAIGSDGMGAAARFGLEVAARDSERPAATEPASARGGAGSSSHAAADSVQVCGMSLHLALAAAGFAAAISLVVGQAARTLGVIALVASALELAMALGFVHFSVAGLPLGLVLGLCLAVPGILAWLRSSSKAGITGAAVVAFVGILQVLGAVGRKL